MSPAQPPGIHAQPQAGPGYGYPVPGPQGHGFPQQQAALGAFAAPGPVGGGVLLAIGDIMVTGDQIITPAGHRDPIDAPDRTQGYPNRCAARGLSASVPPHAAARWAVRLRGQGMSAQDIADWAGLSVTLVRRVLRTPAHDTTVRDIACASADATLGIPLPHRRNPDAPGAPGLTDSAEASWLLADLARAGWPATTLAHRLDVNARTTAEVRDKRPRLHLDLALRIRRLHRDLISLDPAGYGIHPTDIVGVAGA
ncbi:hypothetical protein [Streptomyces collinus]|uniref:hypothetical protein n=1 Tax=Streptomyces collinus TaxID=42684 RepID=UPI0033213139